MGIAISSDRPFHGERFYDSPRLSLAYASALIGDLGFLLSTITVPFASRATLRRGVALYHSTCDWWRSRAVSWDPSGVISSGCRLAVSLADCLASLCDTVQLADKYFVSLDGIINFSYIPPLQASFLSLFFASRVYKDVDHLVINRESWRDKILKNNQSSERIYQDHWNAEVCYLIGDSLSLLKNALTVVSFVSGFIFASPIFITLSCVSIVVMVAGAILKRRETIADYSHRAYAFFANSQSPPHVVACASEPLDASHSSTEFEKNEPEDDVESKVA